MYSKMVDKFDYINTVIAPGFARSNNFYNENSLFTLCTVRMLTLESHD